MDTARCVQAEVSDFHEAARQDVQKKSEHEFQGSEPADLLAACAEDDLVVIDVYQAMVRDGNPMCVQAEVAEESVGFSEGCLGVDHPVLLVEFILQTSKSLGLDELCYRLRGARSWRQLPLLKQAGEAVEEFPTKQQAEDLDR
jgi:hypothetical protein